MIHCLACTLLRHSKRKATNFYISSEPDSLIIAVCTEHASMYHKSYTQVTEQDYLLQQLKHNL